jgi:hypothetical protein
MRQTFHNFLSDEERAGTVLIGGVTAVMLVGFVVAVGLIAFMN